MTHSEQIGHLYGELEKVIHRAAAEYDIPVATTIGCLEMVKLDLFRRELENRIDDEE